MFDAPDDTFLTLWTRQVHATPFAIAVVARGESLTYRDLDLHSTLIATEIQQQKLPPENPIALYFDRDDALSLAALIGILKAGFPYLPLDPTHPESRIQYMLQDANAELVLTNTHHAKTLPLTGVATLTLDTFTGAEVDLPLPSPASHQLAYILYTSGSTGMPKGVMVTHGGLLNYLQWARQAYEVDNGYGAPVYSPLTFDLTITSLLVPLIAGRTVHLLPPHIGVESLRQALLEREDWSLVKLTPAHLDLLRATLPLESLRTRRYTFVIGGEALTYAQTAPWQWACPTIRLINEYGPTETVVGCCIYEIPPASDTSGAVPIGKAIANTTLYILDETFQRVPRGRVGELYIGGAGVARGYLHRSALTAERFIPNPFGAPGSRLYRSGDLARERDDGTLEFCGRADEQLKINGYRIEPAEIEAALGRHPSIREAVVIASPTPTGKQLVAYVVPRGESPEDSALETYLRQHLPPYMLPSRFVWLPELPLTPNGKVDRAHLPSPVSAQTPSYSPPATPIESLVYGIWEEVLGHSEFGADTSFFKAGGDSLTAVQVLARLRAQLEIDIPVSEFFQRPILRDFSSLTEALLFAELEALDTADEL